MVTCFLSFLLTLLLLVLPLDVNARIVVDMASLQDYDQYDYDQQGVHEYPTSYEYEISLASVAYFDREFIDPNLVRIVLESEARMFSMDYVLENYQHSSSNNPNATTSIDDDQSNSSSSSSSINFYDEDKSIDKACNWWQGILLADMSKYSIENITFVADLWYTDFVILIVDEDNYSWQDTFRFWWSHKLPHVSPEYYNMMDKNITPPYFLAVSRVTGNFLSYLLQTVENENGIDWGDCIPYFGIYIDDRSPRSGVDLLMSTFVYLLFVFMVYLWVSKNRIIHDHHQQQQNQHHHISECFQGTELGQGIIEEGTISTKDCAVCLEPMTVGTTVRILPCRHIFHHDCIDGWFQQQKYSCPLCKLDLRPHLLEQRSAAGAIRRQGANNHPAQGWKYQLRHILKWRIIQADENQLLELTSQDGVVLDDLNLREEEEEPTSPSNTALVTVLVSTTSSSSEGQEEEEEEGATV